MSSIKPPAMIKHQSSVVDFQKSSIGRTTWQCCLNCDYFNKDRETCAKAGDQRPPALVIATGCPEWLDDIPF